MTQRQDQDDRSQGQQGQAGQNRQPQQGESGQNRQPQQDQGDRNRQPQQGQQDADRQQQAGMGAGGQQGGATSGAGQQQQFDRQSGQQGGGMGSESRFADQIRPQQQVVDDQGNHVGTVDHLDGDRIKLTKSDASDNQHHYVQLSQVAGIEDDKVRLRERGDNDFGQEAGA